MPQATGKVYAMTGAKATTSGNLLMGYRVIIGVKCCVLYDFGGTHSFVLDVYVNLWYLLRRRVWSGHRPCVLGVRWR